MKKKTVRTIAVVMLLLTVVAPIFFASADPEIALAPVPGGSLDPTTIQKYVDPLVIPPAMPNTKNVRWGGKWHDYYEIAVRQFQQQVLPTGLPQTTVWSYGSYKHPRTFNYPAFTIEAEYNRPSW